MRPTIDRINTRCSICGSRDTYLRSNGRYEWLRYKDKQGNWDRKSYICKKCYAKDYQRDPCSQNSIIKSIANCRTGNLYRNSETGKGIISQAIVAKIFNIDDLNIKKDNNNYHIDMEDSKLKKIDVKSARLYDDGWSFSNYRKIECDTYICLGYDKNGINIDNVWIIDNDDDIINIGNIHIRKKSLKYEKFEVDSKIYNDTYHDLISYLANKKYFGIQDIKNWLIKK